MGKKTDGAAPRVLMARELGPSKLAHRTELQAAMRAGRVTGCPTELRARPIGTGCNRIGELERNMTAARGQRRQRNTRRGMAHLRSSTQGTAVLGQGEPQGVLLTAVRTAAAANDEPWHGTTVAGAKQGHGGRDAEATAQRQFSKRANGQGSTERCRAQPLAMWTRDPARPRPQRGRARCRQSTAGGPSTTRLLARRAAARQSM